MEDVRFLDSGPELSFNPDDIVQNLRRERYVNGKTSETESLAKTAKRRAYYFFRPWMPVPLRKQLQKTHLNEWRKLTFPSWPVDTSVDTLMEQLLVLAIKCNRGKSVPFIWFWPEGMTACALMTHDVEEAAGAEYCSRLMDINESFGIPASFQVVPEERYAVTEDYLESIRSRGFEILVHDLNHDGRLYWNHKEFRRRVARINRYGRKWGAKGFRAGVLYHNQDWFDELDFEFEMSVPNVAHLDPQRGGCCTVMPYFVGKILELPVTATQDYSLFHILHDYSLALWEQQIGIILRQHGIINMIVHPDYLTGPREEAVYKSLLGLYARMRSEHNVWVPLPREANAWWRQRNQMQLVQDGSTWRIEGDGKERAKLALASLEEGRLTYRLVDPGSQTTPRMGSQSVPAEVV
jgi:peptidoglycan/xylan/chitin deacetylase (PgdA/CDA1 family)